MKQTYTTVKQAFIEHHSPAFRAGFILLIINPIIGWGGGPLALAYFTWHQQPRLGMLAGIGIYLFSWFLLGIGALLAGKSGYRISRQVLKEIYNRFKMRKKSPSTSKEL